MQHYDFLVIGSGPAGHQAALHAATFCKKVAMVEKNSLIGGVCLHTGTIPSKTLRSAVLYLTGWDQRGLYGQGYRLKHNLTTDDLMKRLNITIQHEMEVIRTQLARHGVEVLEGSASFIDAHHISILNDKGQTGVVQADKILIATGTTPARPADIPFNDTFGDRFRWRGAPEKDAPLHDRRGWGGDRNRVRLDFQRPGLPGHPD